MIIAIILSVIAILGLLYYLFPPIQVVGDSMFPTYYDQEVIFGRRIYSKSKLKKGDVVVYRSPEDNKRIVIKRIEYINRTLSGELVLYCLGDNSECSHDSRYYGYFSHKNLVCKVINHRGRVFIKSCCKGGSNDEQ